MDAASSRTCTTVMLLWASVLAGGVLCPCGHVLGQVDPADPAAVVPAPGTLSPLSEWAPCDIALKEAMQCDATTASNATEGGPITQSGAISAWKRLLQRRDLSAEQRVFACWRLGSLYAYNFDAKRGEKPDMAQAAEWFQKARALQPGLVSRETINATTVWGTFPGTPAQQAERLAEAYRWLTSRDAEMFDSSAATINALGFAIDRKFYPQLGGAPEPTVEARINALNREVSEAREGLLQRITEQIEYSMDPVASATLVKLIAEIAPPGMVSEWRKMIADSDKHIGLSRILDEAMESPEFMLRYTPEIQPAAGGESTAQSRATMPPHATAGEDQDSDSHGMWMILGAVGLVVLCGIGAALARKRSTRSSQAS